MTSGLSPKLTAAAAIVIKEVDEARKREVNETGSALEHLNTTKAPKVADGATRDTSTDPYTLRIIKGGTFVYDIPEATPAVWGQGDQILWAEGEPLMIAGPTGVGKSTIAAQLLAGRVGIIPEVFGTPIADDGKPVLYLSLDRPSQIRGLLGRLFAGRDARAVLDERLIVWAGPLTAVINSEPGLIAAMAKHHGAGTVIVDSLKDAVTKMTDDEAGGNINRAFQMVIAEGIKLLVLHHQRKASQDSGTPATTIDQIYGSALIAAGMGSVLGIAGKAGAGIVTLTHLKQSQDQVGPYQIEHDKQTGLSKIVDQFDPLEHLKAQGKAGTNSTLCAMAMGHVNPGDAEKKSAKDKLDALHKRLPELVRRSSPPRGGNGGQQAITWHYIEPSIGSL